MGKILCIETGTSTCSVALGDNQQLIALKESHGEEGNHSKNLARFVQEILSEANIQASQLSAVAVSKGPGSYTGLRIGVSVAKGICYAAGLPLIGINSLQTLAQGALESTTNWDGNFLICPCIDARRMEVYTALFNTRLECVQETHALILSESSFAEQLANHKILFVGTGAHKAGKVITHPHALFNDPFLPSARFMIPLALELFNQNKFEDAAYFEPFYLKEFVAKKPKNKVLGNR